MNKMIELLFNFWKQQFINRYYRNRLFIVCGIFCCGMSCTGYGQKTDNHFKWTLTDSQASYLASLPLKCIEQEYPNKLGQTLGANTDLQTPKQLHPAFYGCFDWHSAVHGHWVLASLANLFPNNKNRTQWIAALQSHLTKENIQQELAYFKKPLEKSFERTYGWAWLFALQNSLQFSNDTSLQQLGVYLKPLTDTLVKQLKLFLPKQDYSQRIGTHNNTAFALSFAYDYAKQTNDTALRNVIISTAKNYFLHDKNCPLNWEPSGTDFLSPCLEEVDLMRKILPKKLFLPWLHQFLPQLRSATFNLPVAQVIDRTDGHLVHLDGLNFSRAWVLYNLANQYPTEYGHLKKVGDKHLQQSLPKIIDGNYEGEHWLATFALQALMSRK